MEHTSKGKSRAINFEKRKENLMKKVYELTIVCDFCKACIIINQNDGSSEPEIWPSDPNEVKDMINTYKYQKANNNGTPTTFNISDYYEDYGKKGIEGSGSGRYTTWFDFMNNLSENQLREFANLLNRKLDAAKTRVESIKGNNNNSECSYRNEANSLMMLVMSDNEFVDDEYAINPSKGERCCDSMPGVIESVIDENNTPRMVMKYYSPILKSANTRRSFQ